MSEYRVYIAGQDAPVRVRRVMASPVGSASRAGNARSAASGSERTQAAHASAARESAEQARKENARAESSPTLSLLIVAGVLIVILAVLGWLYGAEVLANASAAIDLARLTEKVPGWVFLGTPVVIVLLVALATVYLTVGRHVALKIIVVAVVGVLLAMPGIALGWVNGNVSVVGGQTEAVKAAVKKTSEKLRPAIPGKAVNVLLIGRDEAQEGDPGRSDTQILVRLDPDTKSISMLSVPRDLRIDIPGVGVDKMNAAYSYGGAALVVGTFSQLTGLEINHYVETDFSGFWHAVNILGGVYIPVDHRYYVAETASYKSIDLAPGYQLLRGHDALDFVRFRHDERGDFGRMQRQQLFLRETQRQSDRWSSDWTKVARMVRAITSETTSDINSLNRLKPLIELVFQVDTAQVHSVHIEGATPTIDGISYVTPTEEEIAAAVAEFKNPTLAPGQKVATSTTTKVTKKMFTVTVVNASGQVGKADTAVTQLKELGYTVATAPDAPEFPGAVTVVYAPNSLATQADDLADYFPDSEVRLVDRAPGVEQGLRVYVTSSFPGSLTMPVSLPTTSATPEATQTLTANANYEASRWNDLASTTKLRLERPTTWSPGFTYDEFYAYKVKDEDGASHLAAVVVAKTATGKYWSIQTLKWLDPPAIKNPTERKTIDGQEYLLFYEGKKLHMIAWKRNKTLYWVLNSLDDELSPATMRGLATSFTRVK